MLMVQGKLAIYYAYMYSHLNYVILVWGSMLSKIKLDKLFKVQKECMRFISNVEKTAQNDPIFNRLKTLKLTQMIDLELHKLNSKYIKTATCTYTIIIQFNRQMSVWKKGINIMHFKNKKSS